MNRDVEIKLEMLRKLHDAAKLNYLTPEKVLFQHVQLLVKPPPLTTEMAECLATLESQRLVMGVHNALGGPVRWKITDNGTAELLNLTQT